MSFLDGKIGNKRSARLEVRLTGEEEKSLENMAASYNMDKSDFARQRLFGKAVDYVKSEIDNAIAKVKNGYQRTSQRVKNYISAPEDIYSTAYSQSGYGLMPAYR